jgi:ParB family chromosome partitioning protein
VPKPPIIGTSALESYNDIFQSTVTPADGERIAHIHLSELYPPDYHPFQVNDDDAMTRLSESIREYGVQEPGVARLRAEGGYELLCGNRRKRACELAGVSDMPVIIRELNDDQAVIVMVSSNLDHRDKTLPSERAWAYRMMMDALNHNGVKGDEYSYEIMIKRTGVKKSQLFRIIRLTELILALLDKVDAGQLSFTAAVELSYLSQKEQTAVAGSIDCILCKPSLSQAQRIKKASQQGVLTLHKIESILSEPKQTWDKEFAAIERYMGYFPEGYTPQQANRVISGLLSEWRSKNARATV